MQDDTGTVCDDRVRPRREGAEEDNMEIEGEEGGNLENDLVAAEDLGEVMDITPSQVTLRATKMFTEGGGAPRMSKEPALAHDPNLWLVKLSKEAISELFEHRYDEVQSSWGAMIDQEEATGYLVCDAMNMEILPGKARTVGKKALKLLKAAKKKDKKHRASARGKRHKARKAAGDDPERAGGLAARLATIDEECQAARAQLWGATVDLALPSGRLAAGPAPAASQPKVAEEAEVNAVKKAEARLAEAEAQLAAAEDAEIQAEHARSTAVRQGRAWPRGFKGPARTQKELLRWSLEPGLERKERRRREDECVKLQVIEHEQRETEMALRKARLDLAAANARAEDARLHAVEIKFLDQSRAEIRRERLELLDARLELTRRECEVAAREGTVAERERELESKVEVRHAAERAAAAAAAASEPKVYHLTGMDHIDMNCLAFHLESGSTVEEGLREVEEIN